LGRPPPPPTPQPPIPNPHYINEFIIMNEYKTSL